MFCIKEAPDEITIPVTPALFLIVPNTVILLHADKVRTLPAFMVIRSPLPLIVIPFVSAQLLSKVIFLLIIIPEVKGMSKMASKPNFQTMESGLKLSPK